MLGGKIEVSSEVGEGSVFTLLLPDELPPVTATAARMLPRVGGGRAGARLAGAEPEPPRGRVAAPRSCARPGAPGRRAPAPELTGVTVLIVDDDVRNVFALTSALELHGLPVLYADNGARRDPAAHRAPRGRRRADGRDDARPGRQRDHPADPGPAAGAGTCRWCS